MRFQFKKNKENKDQSPEEMIREKLGKRSIVLVGLMGAGKTSLGRRLASRLQLPFIDSDDEIEKAANCSVSDIFEKYGEPYFRDREEKIIARLLKSDQMVLATGGGAWMNTNTRQVINKYGVSLWLNADLETLAARVMKRNHRPLLNQGDPKVILQNLIKTRTPIYELADMEITTQNAPLNIAIDQIIKKLAKNLQT